MATILVIGATGNIGKEVVTALSRSGEADVLAGSRDVPRAQAQLRGLERVRVVELDLDRPETIRAATQGVDQIIEIDALSPAMAQHAGAVVSAAREAGVKHLVRGSLMGVDEPEPIEEALWHGDADRAVETSGIPFTILRPTQYFQNFINFGNDHTIRTQGAIYLPLGQGRVSNIDTRDIGEIAARVLLAPGSEHHGKKYVLTGGVSSSMDEIARAIGDALGKPVAYGAVEEAQYRQGMLQAGIPAVIADAILGWFAYCRTGRADRVEPDAARLLGRKPRALEDWARDHVHHYRSEPPDQSAAVQ